ncbi:MAG: alpha-1,4-glucan--maltose-1-phosphate maltosyltransferase [Candidatus Omnitrophica bacterium]|nr:alpha-1,4-glucan--maltose-1-phosphate maltosyltransferase [Candidatus Omnitrophota bacterium]
MDRFSPAPVIIENLTPCIDGGAFAVKVITGELLRIEADIFKDGHDVLKADVLYRRRGSQRWSRSPMKFLSNDRWQGSFRVDEAGFFEYSIEAWTDALSSWMRFIEKKCEVQTEVKTDAEEGIRLLNQWLQTVTDKREKKKINSYLKQLELAAGSSEEILRMIRDSEFIEVITENPYKKDISMLKAPYPLVVDRVLAEFGAWYELFPRSQGKHKTKSGTFKDCIKRLPDIKKMGFDIIYLPPVHPIGRTNRKGKNNTLHAGPSDPGSPWAIGGAEGGHKAVHPELGTLDDFRDFVEAAGDYQIEIALDLAYQCSPDHPYAKEHPEWFYQLPDGTIRYAENPPKKYQDIYPINFWCENREALWNELKSVVLFWIEQGVRIFRVDNPHTKPLRFWAWLIEEIKTQYPDTLFLAEAFTRPKVMKFLAKAGFSQSYTYFTWRNSKHELREYLEELTQHEMKYYFRGNFFTNTPDILHEYLQKGGPTAFKIRLALAATLSSSYGVYSGYEFFENIPLKEGSEEYLNSEKYEIRKRDWNALPNMKSLISRINQIRKDNPALTGYKNLEFFESPNHQVLCYGKANSDLSNIIICAVMLDPYSAQEDLVRLPIWKWGIEPWQTYQMKDLVTGQKFYWKGESNYIRLDSSQPAHILKLTK